MGVLHFVEAAFMNGRWYRCCNSSAPSPLRFSSLALNSRRLFSAMSSTTLLGAIDQGTTSTRFILFEADSGRPVSVHQQEHPSTYPKPGWCQQNPDTIVANAVTCMNEAVKQYASDNKCSTTDLNIAGVGITNQRETTVLWDSVTSTPLHDAVVWLDLRTKKLVDKYSEKYGGIDAFRGVTGLPISTYFSALKLKWLVDNVPEVQHAVQNGTCNFGTIDSYLIYRLTGNEVHATDISNASRTMLLSLQTGDWDASMFDAFEIPRNGINMPAVQPTAHNFGSLKSSNDLQLDPALEGVPISGCIGDQQSATIGQLCFQKGQMKCTYGTGCFLLMNAGPIPADEPEVAAFLSDHSGTPSDSVRSHLEAFFYNKTGLLSTALYQIGKDAPVHYALEGSVAIAGEAVKFLRDNLKLITSASQVEALARNVDGTGGVVFVPALSGLYCPYWRPDARGLIIGMTQYTTADHIARATLEGVAHSAADVVEAMTKEGGISASELPPIRVDGGMVVNSLLLEIQSNFLQTPVVKPEMLETTALGAAIMAGLGVGVYTDVEDVCQKLRSSGDTDIQPSMGPEDARRHRSRWAKAVQRTFDWADDEF